MNYAEVEKCATVDASVTGSAPLLRTWTRVKGIDESASVVVDVMVSLMSEVSTGVRTGGMRECRDHSDALRQGTSLSTVLDCWS